MNNTTLNDNINRLYSAKNRVCDAMRTLQGALGQLDVLEDQGHLPAFAIEVLAKACSDLDSVAKDLDFYQRSLERERTIQEAFGVKEMGVVKEEFKW